MFTQLNPSLPIVVEKEGEWLKGYAFACIDYSQEHDLLWVVIIDDTREIWCVPNQKIRAQSNWSLNRC